MKVVVYEVEDWERDAFRSLPEHHDVAFTASPLTAETAREHADAEAVSTFIYSSLGANVLENLPNLKLIATRSTGFDHIDMDYCAESEIAVANVPAYGDNTVAEHTFGLLLTLSHNLYFAIDRTRKGDFSQAGLQGFDLRGKTLGVVGTGNIGQCVMEIAKGFKMEVVAHDIQEDEEAAKRLGFEYVPFEELLERADIVTLHVPGSKKTEGLIGADEFKRMRDGVILINTSRGSVVDIRALTRALAEGKVAGAGLDVLPEEPVIREEAELLRSVYQRRRDLESLLAGHILMHLRKVIVTPHTAFNTVEAVQRIIDVTVENIKAFAQGEPKNLVMAQSG